MRRFCMRKSGAVTVAVAVALAMGLAGTAAAESARGFYLSQSLGLNLAPEVELRGNSNDRASRCDEFINPRYAEVPGCTDPNRGSGAGWSSSFDDATGLLTGIAVGYRFAWRLRAEVEWFYRSSEYDQTSPVSSATGDTLGKLDGEIQRADNRIGTVSSQAVFGNVYVDFPRQGRLTPYVGFGVGVGRSQLDYSDLWARNPDPAAIGTAAGLANEQEVRRNLAATTTSKQGKLDDRITGYQIVGGVDYVLSDSLSIGVKVRWVRLGQFVAEGISWERLRSHPSQLRLDGSEPVTFRIRTADALSFAGASLEMRYTF